MVHFLKRLFEQIYQNIHSKERPLQGLSVANLGFFQHTLKL